jgi:hypothetical protein
MSLGNTHGRLIVMEMQRINRLIITTTLLTLYVTISKQILSVLMHQDFLFNKRIFSTYKVWQLRMMYGEE